MYLAKLNTKALGLKKPITVAATVKNTRLASQIMIKALEFEDQTPDADDMVTTLKLEQELLDELVKFLQIVMKLSEEQMNKILDHIDFRDLVNYTSYVCQRIKGMSEGSYRKLVEELKKTPAEETEEPSNGKSTSSSKK